MWYFGEDTAEFDEQFDVVTTEGTWHTGEAGALPGIFMPANPMVGETHRQEYYAGYAEDFFRVADVNASITVPYGSFTGALPPRNGPRSSPARSTTSSTRRGSAR